jgi:hypothetical protein
MVGLVACGVHSELRVAPPTLEQAASQLGGGSPAELETIEGIHARVRPDQDVVIVGLDGKRFPVKLAELVHECPSHSTEPNQVCAFHGVRDVVVGTYRTRRDSSIGGYAIASSIAVGVVGLGICGVKCDTPYNYIADGALIATGIALVYALLDSRWH